MKVHRRKIQSDGLHIEGEEECPIADLAAEGILCAGPLRYSLDLGITAGDLWANGTLEQPVTLECVVCLQPFEYTIAVPAFALHTELPGPELIDLTPFVREDILLNLPPHPHCDRDGRRVCPGAKTIPARDVEYSEEAAKRQPDWSALDKLDL